jgi:Contractile injection system tube protein
MNLSKAYLLNVDTGKRIECLFNPKAYTFSNASGWFGDQQGSQAQASHQHVPGGQPTALKLQLFFDTSHLAQTGRRPEDVRKKTEEIWELIYVMNVQEGDSSACRPPKVRFGWEGLDTPTWTFDAYVETIAQQFTMFVSDGTPVRAKLDLTLKRGVTFA